MAFDSLICRNLKKYIRPEQKLDNDNDNDRKE